MSELVIRELTAKDLPRVVPLLNELGYPTTSELLEKRFDFFSSKGERALVAISGKRLIGLLTLHVTHVLHRPGSVGRVTTLVVAEDSHGNGIGRALMEEAERRLWAQGCVLIEVTSNMKRADAHAFYEKLGYERTSYRFGKTRANDS